MKAVQIIGLAIVGILLISNSLNALAIGLALVLGQAMLQQKGGAHER